MRFAEDVREYDKVSLGSSGRTGWAFASHQWLAIQREPRDFLLGFVCCLSIWETDKRLPSHSQVSMGDYGCDGFVRFEEVEERFFQDCEAEIGLISECLKSIFNSTHLLFAPTRSGCVRKVSR